MTITLPAGALTLAVRTALDEDLGAEGDPTSRLLGARAGALLVAREPGVIAGLPAVDEVLAEVRQRLRLGPAAFRPEVADSAPVEAGAVIGHFAGPARVLLAAERTMLNLLGHLSGVATLTAAFVEAVAGTGAVVRDTRKTTPGLRYLEKYAVRCGGGANHRMGLYDALLVKDNHIQAAGSLRRAVEAARAAGPGLPLEVEVETLEQVAEALDLGCDLLLLDNMELETMAEAVKACGRRARTEASGGITLERARAVAGTGVDFLAVGAITHSAPSLDIALDWEGVAVLLAVDVGNTEITIGVFQDDELAQHWRASTVAERTADEHALLLDGFLGQEGLGLEDADGVVVSSVVPRLTQALREMVRRYCQVEPLVIEPGIRTGLPILTDNPREVGADRVVNAIAAYEAYGGPVVVVDFGTATTFDAVSERGEHLGAAIAPGIQISMNALVERTAQLRRVELVEPRSVIGKNTVESLQAGAIWGFAGQVDGIVRRMVAELGGSATVVATGGLAGAVLDACETVQRHEPWLTLHGLRILWDRNLEVGKTVAERLPRPDRVEGRALSPRSFRPFGIEAVVLGPPVTQEGLVRRQGVAVWRRMDEHGPVFDRLAATAAVDPDGLLPVRVVVAATPARDRAMRVPAMGERAARVQAASDPPPAAGWLLLVDEGPGETWLYLPEEDHPAAVLDVVPGPPRPHRLRPRPPPLRDRHPGQPRAAPRAVPGDLRQRPRPGCHGPARRRRDGPGLPGRAGQGKAALAAPGSNPGPWGMGGRGPGLDSGGAPHVLAGAGTAGPGSDPDDPTPRWRTEVLGAAATQLRVCLPGEAVVVIGAAPAGVGGPDREGSAWSRDKRCRDDLTGR